MNVFKRMFYSFLPPAQSSKVFRRCEFLVTEADGARGFSKNNKSSEGSGQVWSFG